MKISSAPAAQELGYAEITATSGSLGTSDTDISGLAVTFTAGTRPIMVAFNVYSLQQGSSAGLPFLTLTDNSNTAILLAAGGNLAANANSPSIYRERRLTSLTSYAITPGSTYTFKLRGATTVSTTVVVAGATYPAFLRVYEV